MLRKKDREDRPRKQLERALEKASTGKAGLADKIAEAAEVVVMWGDMSVLHVEHLSPPRSFSVGEGDVDYADMTVEELRGIARARDIEGRSEMNKAQLVEALRDA